MSALQDIDVRLLRAFVAVADTGRMTTAARVVNVSQGAVSQQIKRLETLFDCLLFRRDADLMRLTREGERLMVRAQRLIALNDEIVGIVQIETPARSAMPVASPPSMASTCCSWDPRTCPTRSAFPASSETSATSTRSGP